MLFVLEVLYDPRKGCSEVKEKNITIDANVIIQIIFMSN
jgi:hypothetical protein